MSTDHEYLYSEATYSLMRMSEHNHRLREANANLYNVLAGLREAVTNHNEPNDHHKKLIGRHRSEWPYLWDHIDQALEALYNYEQSF